MKTGYIYHLKSFQTDKIYVGSTILTIKVRFSNHKVHYKRWLNNKMYYISSFELLQYNDCYIELIKEVYCIKKLLNELENEEINKNKNCTNRIQAIRSIEQKKLYHIKYDQQDHIKQYHKQYNKQYIEIRLDCACGASYSATNKSNHFKTKKHQSYLSSLT